jgi:hypothetical protein
VLRKYWILDEYLLPVVKFTKFVSEEQAREREEEEAENARKKQKTEGQ